MKQVKHINQAAIFLFTITVAAFFIFFFYMSTAEKVSVYQAASPQGYSLFEDMQPQLHMDDTAPAGVRTVYQGILPLEVSLESCLCFNISHHEIQVYFDDILVYSLTGSEGNRIGKNVSSNWCCVSVGPNHAGETVTVVLTPMFEAAISKTPVFLLGSRFAIAMDLLTGEMPLMILSSLCILLGLFVFAVSLYYRYITRSATSAMTYLGLFSILLGLWKLTDLRCISLLTPQNAMALGYISVGSLFLASLSLQMYFITLIDMKAQKALQLLFCFSSLVCLYVLAMQVLGITEIRQNLMFSHLLLIATLTSVPLTALLNRIIHKSWGLHRSWKLIFLIAAGIVFDLLFYYRNNGNGLMSFTIMSFIIYTLIVFLTSVQDTTQKAYTDSLTGLVNRIRWNELMNGDSSIPEPYAILVVDLNGLKQVNDTFGHDAGDQMIFQFSNILRNTLPRSSVICRWGGDEFSVLLSGVNRIQLDQQTDELFAAGERYNAEHPELPVHFAIGSALSPEHPGISRTELFQLADEEMYKNKQLWYKQKHANS